MESTNEEAATAAAPILEGDEGKYEGCVSTAAADGDAGGGGNLNGDSGLVDLPPSGVVELGDLKLRF